VQPQHTIDNLLQILDSGQDSALIRFGLANAYLANQDPRQAIAHLNEAIRLDETYSAAWKLLGKAQQALGQNREARTTFERGIEVARQHGDMQAAREMEVFKQRLEKSASQDSSPAG
jgi:Tfp pilus assembly protein PilF